MCWSGLAEGVIEYKRYGGGVIESCYAVFEGSGDCSGLVVASWRRRARARRGERGGRGA